MLIRERERMERDYTRPGAKIAFSGRTSVGREAGMSAEKANKEFLSYIYSYPLHRFSKRPKRFNPFFSFSPREQLQCDLVDVSQLRDDNDDVRFLLVCIDIFTKKIWVRALTSKHAKKVHAAFIDIFTNMHPSLPKAILLDRGNEFTNNLVERMCEERNIKIIHPNSNLKAAIAERVNRTLQDLIYRYMTEKQTNRYIDVLDRLVHTYNIRGHRSLGYMSPNDAENPNNLGTVRNKVFHERGKVIIKGRKMNPKFEVGDTVRIKKEDATFQRGYHPRFSREYFRVVAINHRLPIITYTVQSLNKEDVIEGGFYAEELQLVKGDVFKVERIEKRRKRRGKKEIFVKWFGFDENHNSWIPESNLILQQ